MFKLYFIFGFSLSRFVAVRCYEWTTASIFTIICNLMNISSIIGHSKDTKSVTMMWENFRGIPVPVWKGLDGRVCDFGKNPVCDVSGVSKAFELN